MRERIEQLTKTPLRTIVGKMTIRLMLVALLAGGHASKMSLALAKPCLPNLWLAQLTDDFSIPAAPDLLPCRYHRHQRRSPKRRNLNISPGPVFANIITTDEINRYPAPNPRF